MKRRHLLCNCKMPMNLQIFADGGDGAGADGGNGGGSEGGSGSENPNLSFDDFLQLEGNQAEFDRRVQKSINTALTREKEKWQTMADDKISEAEKLSKMNKEEKAAYLQQKKENEIAEREAAVTRKELMAEAKNTLAEKKLPTGLAELLNYENADVCKKSIETMEKAFQAAVEAAVQDRLKGGEPIKKAPAKEEADLEKQVEAIMRGEL